MHTVEILKFSIITIKINSQWAETESKHTSTYKMGQIFVQ